MDLRRMWNLLGAAALLVVAASSPVMGYGASEHYSGQKFYGVLEGDWLMLFALVAGVVCVRAALRLIRAEPSSAAKR